MTHLTTTAPPPAHKSSWFHAPTWFHDYNARTLGADAIAGLTLAAYLLPAAIADASLARLPPQAGVYACVFSGLVFGWLCSSRRTVISVTAPISLLMGTSLGAIAGGDVTRYSALAAGTALLVAAVAFAAFLLRAGSLASFVSETVLLGFKAGASLTLLSTQLPKLMGISGIQGGFWQNSRHFLTHLNEINWAAFAIGLSALALLIAGKLLFKAVPAALVVVIAGIVAAKLLNLDAYHVKMLGEVPQGLPIPALPAVQWSDLNDLLPLAMACFLLGAVETSAVGRMMASRHADRLNPNQELLALAAANLASGLGRGFPVSGGMSQSLVNESAGARTPVSGIVAALLLALVALFFTGLLRNLPQPVLAAVILMAVPSLINLRALAHLWKTDRSELLIALAALAGVLASGLLRGVLIGAMISLLLLIRLAARPHIAFLGRVPGTRRYSDMERSPTNEPTPGILIFRPEGSMVYFNAENVREQVVERVRHATPPVHTVIGDLSSSPRIDLAGADMIKSLATELRAMGAALHIVEARSSVRDRLLTQGLEEVLGPIDRLTSVADAVDAASTLPHGAQP